MNGKFKGLKIVSYYTGYIILGFSILNLLPISVALLYSDFSSALLHQTISSDGFGQQKEGGTGRTNPE